MGAGWTRWWSGEGWIHVSLWHGDRVFCFADRTPCPLNRRCRICGEPKPVLEDIGLRGCVTAECPRGRRNAMYFLADGRRRVTIGRVFLDIRPALRTATLSESLQELIEIQRRAAQRDRAADIADARSWGPRFRDRDIGAD
jgi:hypothetical protein